VNHILLILMGMACGLAMLPATGVQAAEPIILSPELHRLSLGKRIDILEDPAKQWRIDDIVSVRVAALFSPSQETSPGFGFATSAYWVRFTVLNPLAEERQWYLEIAYPPMDRIDLYSPQPAGGFQVRSAGDRFPFKQREVQHRHFIFHMRAAPQSQHAYYLRFETAGVINLPLLLLSPAALAEKINNEQIVLGIYHGAILVMLVYNFFLFLSIRDRSYLYYVLFNSGWIMAMLTLNGLAFQYLWPRQVWWTNNSLLFFFCFSFVWGVQFSRTFLQTRQHTPSFDIVLRVLIVFGSLGVLASLMTSYAFSVRLTNIIGMCTVLVWLNGYICLTQGARPARYYVLAWSALIVGVAILSLKNFGFLPHNTFTIWAPQIGSVTEITLLSLGLADRIKTLQREKERAQKELLETKLTMQDALLKEVHHRVKNNLQVISSLLNLQSGYVQDARVVEMFRESRQRVESMALVHDKLYHSNDSTRIDFAAYTHTLATHLFASYGAMAEGIALRVNIDAITLSVDTAIPCGLILNELVANAVQHAFPAAKQGEVCITLHADENGRFVLGVADNGIGFPPHLDFRHTTSLGLQLVTTLTEQLDGTIELEHNGGTTFTLAFRELTYKERSSVSGS
jgi:two-component system, sensor histidine kinase LadS